MSSTSNSLLNSPAIDEQGRRATDERRRRLSLGRRGLLLCLLAALSLVLIGYSGRLRLSYDLVAAQRALREADADSAVEILQRDADRGAQSSEWNYLMARALRRADRLTDAEQMLARAKQLGWNAQDIRREELLMRARRGEVKKIGDQLLALLASGPSDEIAEEIYEAMAQGFWASYYVGDALECLKYWREWQPNSVLPRIWIADLYERSKRPEESIAEYRKVLEIDPNNQQALTRLADILLAKLELAESADLFVRLLTLSREAPEGLLGLADCLRRQGRGVEAKELLFEALTLEITQRQAARATGILGTIALEDHDYFRAVELLRESNALEPNDAGFHASLAAALMAVGQEDMAAAERKFARETSDRHSQLVLVTAKVANNPNEPDFRCEAGQILMDQGFWSEGADWVKTALAIDPDHVAAHALLAKYYEHIGDRESANQHRAASGQSDDPDARSNGESG